MEGAHATDIIVGDNELLILNNKNLPFF